MKIAKKIKIKIKQLKIKINKQVKKNKWKSDNIY
jgi:hypothetical protein